jgi:hypothetical protein
MTSPAPTPTTVDLLVALTRLETKLDTATTGIADHETRIRAVEQSAVTEAETAQLRADVESLKRGPGHGRHRPPWGRGGAAVTGVLDPPEAREQACDLQFFGREHARRSDGLPDGHAPVNVTTPFHRLRLLRLCDHISL